VVAEISAPVPARCRIEDAVKWMGAERVVFGSDFPIIHPAYMLGCVNEAEVSEEAKGLIVEGSARRLLARAEAKA
jgi:predicted TIM-barrel fold metal-dependent hydrolase